MTKLSIIVPVLNEAGNLAASLFPLREGAHDGVEIIVVDGGSADGTLEAARQWADKVIVSPPGRAAQMHRGALEASGDVLLFLHGDTRLPSGWRDRMAAVWDRPKPPAAAAFRLSLDAEGWRYRLVEKGSALRTALTGVPLGDQALSVRRDRYLAVGGFPDVPLMEEYCLLSKLKRYGRVEIIEAPVLTSARRHRRNGPIRNGLKNDLITLLFFCGVSPARLARMYR